MIVGEGLETRDWGVGGRVSRRACWEGLRSL